MVPSDLGSPLWRHVGGALLSTHRTKLFGGGAPAVVGFLANGNTHDADGIADHVGGALLALGPVGIGALLLCALAELIQFVSNPIVIKQ